MLPETIKALLLEQVQLSYFWVQIRGVRQIQVDPFTEPVDKATFLQFQQPFETEIEFESQAHFDIVQVQFVAHPQVLSSIFIPFENKEGVLHGLHVLFTQTEFVLQMHDKETASNTKFSETHLHWDVLCTYPVWLLFLRHVKQVPLTQIDLELQTHASSFAS